VQILSHSKLSVPSKLRSAMSKVCDALARGDFYSADLKKLSGSELFRAKLDYDNRLLVRFVEHAGRRACLLLEVIEQHAYDRSRFLRGARVQEADVAALPAAAEPEVAAAIQKVRYLHPGRTEFHLLDKPLSFDDRQEQLFRLPLPMVLVGCAGSGKTALTLTKLRELRGEVLYVTQSAYLAESAANLYFAHGYENGAQNVDFLSYRALLESIELPKGRPVTLKDFRSFFKRHEQSVRFTTAHQLFEELRGVIGAQRGGALDLEQYRALGVKRSIYAPEQRPAVHALFAKYKAFLGEEGLYDTNLVAHAYQSKVTARYDAIVVDEVQDLTNAELSLLLALLKDREQFLLCGDANQIVHPNFFSWSGVKSLFYSEEEAALTAPVHVLEANYRSSRIICSVANDLLKIKNSRFGSIDRESTALVRAASDQEGKLIGLVKKDSVLRELNQRTRGSVNVAVLVLDEERKAEARQKFSTPLVFSVHEAKGLEYEAVILYDLISCERARFREVTEGVTRAALDTDELTYARAKDKSDKALEVYKFFVNALYVSLTRAVDTLYVVESDVEHPLLRLLQVSCGEDLSQVATKQSSLDDWQREARRLELQGKEEQAALIREKVLRLTPVPWPVLGAAEVRDLSQKAFAPNSAFNKAKQRLFEFAAYHGLGSLAYRLKFDADYTSPKPAAELAGPLRERAMSHYRADDKKVLEEVARYGLEHRSMFGLTPLMMAAEAGNVPLTEALLERGARTDAVDALGRMPVHFALRRAFTDEGYASEKLGALFALLCPNTIDLEVGDKRLRLTRAQGEFLVLLLMVARFHDLHAGLRRYVGFQTAHIDAQLLHTFPRSVVPEDRRRRTYWNGVLARAEVDSRYQPARKLWRRERQGHYIPSDVGVRVAGDPGKPDVYVPLDRALGLDFLESRWGGG
jgi:AAA domain/Ankyrin repeats (many copies)